MPNQYGLPPGPLAAYLSVRDANQRAGLVDTQNAAGLMGILAQAQNQRRQQEAQQQEQEVRGVLAQSGGDPQKAMGILLQAGNVRGAAALAPLLKQQGEAFTLGPDQSRFDPSGRMIAQGQPKPEAPYTLSPGAQRRGPNNEIIAEAPLQERTPQPSNVARLIGERDALAPDDPKRKLYDTAITHVTNPQSQRIIIPPQPRNLQLTTDEDGNQLIVNPDGSTRPLMKEGGVGVRKPVAADKPMTEFQGKAALYGTRAAQSDKVLKTLEEKISTAGLSAGQAMGTAGNLMMSSEQRRVNQAQRDFVNAVLRQESGAVISDAEFENAKKQYFPATGDDPNTIAQKRANRQLAIAGFARMSGPKGAAEIKTISDNPLLPGQSPARRATDSLPATNSKGWRLMTDANGRKAYVGPNNEIEEVK